MGRKKKKKWNSFSGMIRYSPVGLVKGAFDRSKKLRKIGLIAGATVGAFYAAPYALAAGKFAAAGGTLLKNKIGSVAGNLINRKLAPGQVGDQVEPIQQTSPTESNFYNEYGAGPQSAAANFRVPIGAAASGAGLSSCGAARASDLVNTPNIFDIFIANLTVVDWILAATVITILVGIGVEHFYINKTERNKESF